MAKNFRRTDQIHANDNIQRASFEGSCSLTLMAFKKRIVWWIKILEKNRFKVSFWTHDSATEFFVSISILSSWPSSWLSLFPYLIHSLVVYLGNSRCSKTIWIFLPSKLKLLKFLLLLPESGQKKHFTQGCENLSFLMVCILGELNILSHRFMLGSLGKLWFYLSI